MQKLERFKIENKSSTNSTPVYRPTTQTAVIGQITFPQKQGLPVNRKVYTINLTVSTGLRLDNKQVYREQLT